jgi:hypothetical protein
MEPPSPADPGREEKTLNAGWPPTPSARAHAVRIANELAQAGEYGGVAIKVLDEQRNEVAYVPKGKRSD